MDFEITIDDGIATLIFDQQKEKVNLLSHATLDELLLAIDSLYGQINIRALILISGKPNHFCAGADLKAFLKGFQSPKIAQEFIYQGHKVFNRLYHLPIPTVALIDGGAFGGGVELALACRFRVLCDQPKTVITFPETKLGLVPSWGGTQRLWRKVGVKTALDMILNGKKLFVKEALKCHFADFVVRVESKEREVKAFVKSLLKEEVFPKERKKRVKDLLLEENPLGRAFLFWRAKRNVLEMTEAQREATLLALQLIKESTKLSLEEGLQNEMETVAYELNHQLKGAEQLIEKFFK